MAIRSQRRFCLSEFIIHIAIFQLRKKSLWPNLFIVIIELYVIAWVRNVCNAKFRLHGGVCVDGAFRVQVHFRNLLLPLNKILCKLSVRWAIRFTALIAVQYAMNEACARFQLKRACRNSRGRQSAVYHVVVESELLGAFVKSWNIHSWLVATYSHLLYNRGSILGPGMNSSLFYWIQTGFGNHQAIYPVGAGA